MNTFEFKNLVKDLKDNLKERTFFKVLRKEVETGANGTQDYVVKKGITLVNTQAATNGVTSTDHRFFGTASNSDRLGGSPASDYLKASSSNFNAIVRFADAGLTVGDSNDLKISIANGNEGSIANEVGTKIDLKVNVNNVVTSIAEVVPTGINPGSGNRTLGTPLGTNNLR